ncbi:histone-lysine N-methyltransferase CLF-like isoform X3 [Phoenix dactylifera]|uniref:Histone-lysine N-methyltransferase CLF-like isoform X3 n=1 Tax=Phoenix dactylifera TaxID=42345 RepID=A0A8B9ANT9_PHODC|nr:histone-lysine N-methyltransferase CLF-like isoform X3 [Phoenix dactylifera]
MASKASSSASASKSMPSTGLQITGIKEGNHTSQDILSVIDSLMKQVVADRYIYIKERMEENKQKLSSITQHLCNLSKFRRDTTSNNTNIDVNLLTKRQDDALCMLSSLELSGGEKDSSSCQEESSYASSIVLIGSNYGGKNTVRPIKLPEVPKLPPYTTWIFLDRNQRMAEDQSVVGRRRIYYDQSCGEALICSDSEDDVVDDEEEKRQFGSTEDFIIRMTIQKVGLSDAVLDSLAQCLERSTDEIRARYESIIKIEKTEECVKKGEGGVEIQTEDALSEKDLDAALDSFDNLFCRRCLVFDCRLHGCSQDLVFPSEKQLPWSNSDDVTPCCGHCYKLVPKSERMVTMNSEVPHVFEEPTQSSGSARASLSPKKKSQGSSVGRKAKSHQSESASSNARVVSESSESEVDPRQDAMSVQLSSPLKIKQGGKSGIRKKDNKRIAERALVCMRKKQKKMVTPVPPDSDSIVNGCLWPHDMKLRSNTRNGSKDSTSSSQNKLVKSPIIRSSRKKGLSHQDSINSAYIETQNDSTGEIGKESLATDCDESSRKEEFVDENSCRYENTRRKSWKMIEQSLFVKGLEIFGRNSCLIARNLLSGMKTCMEVFQYMNYVEDKRTYGAADGANSLVEGHAKGNELQTRSRFLRRRGRVRRLKYTWKSAGYHSIRKRITERKDQPYRQYNPCGCQSACGKQCPCLVNGTCCEKYCGCPKICKNRFRGCHCAKSQCRSRQCPCFAADRECDPDVCRNCWVGCGDGTLGGPNQRGDNYECRNMKLLLKQQQRVLLGRSDVSGWGAFLKNSVGKHEYLGEYTGELISHREADKRGKIYDRENSSFLFNLNDQFVLDAYRKGDKLKFANHSPDPNCYAKVIMVAGDHRVGIFAKERISAGEELFYDYRYEPDRAPAWARKPEASGSKKDEMQPSTGRAKKLA